MLVRIFDHLSYNIHIVIREVLILDMTVTVHEARTYNPTCKMIFLILSFTILICVNPIKSGATTPEDSNILGDGNGVKCEEMNKPGWSILSLANKTLDAWPWNCINSRYTERTLNEEVSKVSPDIFDATAKDYIGYVQFYFERRVVGLCDNFNEDGENPMHLAIIKGHFRIVKYFLTNNFRLHCKLLRTRTKLNHLSPPMCAALYGQLDILKYLFKERNRLSTSNGDGDYVNPRDLVEDLEGLASAAAKKGHQHVLKYLVDEKGFVIKQGDGALLALAAFGGNVDMLEFLLYEKNMSTSINETELRRRDADSFNCRKMALLCNAIGGGKLDAVILLFKTLNHTHQLIDYDKKSNLLVLAVKNGNLPVVKYMIEEKGAYLNVTNLDSYGLLHIAAYHGALAVVKYLVESMNMDVESKRYQDETPLHVAILSGRLDVVKYLAGERNASLNILPGSNALLEAADKREDTVDSSKIDLKIVQFLVDDMKMISRIDEVDDSSETAAMKAAFNRKLDVLKFLVDDRHANITIMPSKKTLLHFAVGLKDLRPDSMPILKYLIEEKGFKVSARTEFGETVFDVARETLWFTKSKDDKRLTYLKKKLNEELSTKS